MTTVAFVLHERRETAIRAVEKLTAELTARGVSCVRVDWDDPAPPPADLDLVVSVGGDGTFLRAAHVAWGADAPVLGVMVGRLGFLTEVDPSDALPAVLGALEGHARIEERLAVVAEAEGAADFAPQWGLNEVMVEKSARHRLVRLAVEIDGTYVTTFSADGVVVATPTGSTAYSFSARGPIVTPSVACLVLTPIAAHMVFDRSFVLPASACVRVLVEGEEPALVSADGRESVVVPVGARVAIRAATRPLRFVRLEGAPGFLSLVREKFGLPGERMPIIGDGGERGDPGRSDAVGEPG